MSGRPRETINDIVDSLQEYFIALSDNVWDSPELLYEETLSAAYHRTALEKFGFRIVSPLGNIPTAMSGEAGQGGPVIAILGEFDALPGLSQRAGLDYPEPVEPGGNGHGCGHNLLGAGALLAAAAIKAYLHQHNLPGRVRYYGCPAEEGGAAKSFLVRDGLFAVCAAALSWHPMAFSGLIPPRSLAATMVDFTFLGRSAHAAGNPHLGRSALDAAELMSVGVNYLREHVPTDVRMHYAFLDAGGRAPNVVPARAVVRYSIRASNRPVMLDTVDRVRKVAEGAALMTGTSVSDTVTAAMSELLGNRAIDDLLHRKLTELGPPEFANDEREFAKKIRATLTPEDIRAAYKSAGIPFADAAVCDWILPRDADSGEAPGSTDLGDVSWVLPFGQIGMSTCAIGTPGHSWQMTSQEKSRVAHKGMVQAAKVLAAAAIDLLAEPGLLAQAQSEHRHKAARDPYRSPLPPGALPGSGAHSG